VNILLIEDEADLAAAAVAQLELMGHAVAVVHDLARAESFLERPDFKINLVIADHRLPDGLGIDFVLKMRERYDGCDYVIVSGCLSSRETELLDREGLTYYHKPLLYHRVIDSLRRERAMKAPIHVPEVPAQSEPPVQVASGDAGAAGPADRPKRRLFALGRKKNR
jgi:DNA-binding NtrC family response regulator